jgi:hypothetical protein
MTNKTLINTECAPQFADNSAYPWRKQLKQPELWTEEEIHDLVMRELGQDTLFPLGFEILVKIWTPGETDKNGLLVPGQVRRNERIEASVGKVLRFGDEAFQDRRRFVLGSRLTFDEWYIFKTSQRQLIRVGEHYAAIIVDERFGVHTLKPDDIQTTHSLEYIHTGA